MTEKQPKTDNFAAWEDLVVSILSVNNYSLEKTYCCINGLREQGLFSPENLIRWNPGEIGSRLKSAGYDRGRFMTGLFAQRLTALGMLIASTGPEVCTKIISSTDPTAIKALLLPVHGIGPRVIDNFCILREIQK